MWLLKWGPLPRGLRVFRVYASHHWLVVTPHADSFPGPAGPHEIQAKYMGNSSCHSILIPRFWLRVWWGSQWPGNHLPAKKPHTPGNPKHWYIVEARAEKCPGYLKRDTPFQFWRKCSHIKMSLRKPELMRMCQWGNLIPHKKGRPGAITFLNLVVIKLNSS